MAETPRNEGAQETADLVGAARDRGLEHLEGAKGELAEGAERVAAAVDRTADELGGEGDGALSGFGHSVASVMRQLAGGLRERDVEAFAHELGALARRNPGVFLAGSVALGFGMARFFKARPFQSYTGPSTSRDYGWQDRSGDGAPGAREEFDADESLDLSAGSSKDSAAAQAAASRDDDRNQSKSRQSGKHKAKPQRASTGGSHQQAGTGSQAPAGERSPTEQSPSPTVEAGAPGDSPFTGDTGGAPRGGKS